MFSLIVCSINPDLLLNLKENVAKTIGVPHEWLIWDNRKIGNGLCEVYNSMAAKAQFPNLCFIHEDILFDSNNWGDYIGGLLNRENWALVGIAGSSYKSASPSGWYSGGAGIDYSWILHRENGNDYLLSFPEKWTQTEERVVCIDGVFMACKKETWRNSPFNEHLLKGFHFYDIDFSLRIAEKYPVCVTKNLNIIHLTKGGDFGNPWIRTAFLFHNNAPVNLPAGKALVDQKKADLKVISYWLDWLKNQPISFKYRLKWVFGQHLYLHLSLWYGICKFMLYRLLGLRSIHMVLKKVNRKR